VCGRCAAYAPRLLGVVDVDLRKIFLLSFSSDLSLREVDRSGCRFDGNRLLILTMGK